MAAYKGFRRKLLPQAGLIPAEEVKLARVPKGDKNSPLGVQVRVPISELKSWIEERIAF